VSGAPSVFACPIREYCWAGLSLGRLHRGLEHGPVPSTIVRVWKVQRLLYRAAGRAPPNPLMRVVLAIAESAHGGLQSCCLFLRPDCRSASFCERVGLSLQSRCGSTHGRFLNGGVPSKDRISNRRAAVMKAGLDFSSLRSRPGGQLVRQPIADSPALAPNRGGRPTFGGGGGLPGNRFLAWRPFPWCWRPKVKVQQAQKGASLAREIRTARLRHARGRGRNSAFRPMI